MAEFCPFCQEKIGMFNSPKTCPKCGTAYCTRMGCGIGLMHKCPICQAKPQLTAITRSISQPSQSVRFVIDNLGEQTGVLLEMDMVEQLRSYITAVYHQKNPKQERTLALLITPNQSIVDSQDRESAVILSPRRWEKLVAWLAEIEAQTSHEE